MGSLAREARALQNPALGAAILWGFCLNYYDTHSIHNAPPLPLAFLVLPLVFHESTRALILGTKSSSSLRMFAEKFTGSKISQSDVLATLPRRVVQTRSLTMDSLRILVSCGMVALDIESGTVFPSKVRGFNQNIPDPVEQFIKAAMKLGHWMAPLSLYEIAATLRVAF